MEVEEFFAGHPDALDRYRDVAALLDPLGPYEVRVSKSQVAFRRRRGFAYLWLPGRWLARPAAEAVLSVALPFRLDSVRVKEVAHPAATVWMHHLEMRSPSDIDDEVAAWLTLAYENAR